ncbi:hypothetical protein DFR30_1548 [Thiogranum longum]|uniref:Tetratricopeptide repeat protein n=1 Tax=Thiogranum longum TaxID=1537524 RepID=A0A4R1HM23_9GAMM|nr:hypothetical protein [Thiogranum longum]TCK18272.1 hypothetical protein DFR30_1548 [Thiogranum longum]
MRALLWPLTLLVVLITGCASQPASNTVTDTLASRPDAGSFEQFGKALAASMAARDSTLFTRSLDTEQFARRSLTSLGLAAVKKQAVASYAKSLQKIVDNRFGDTFSSVQYADFLRLMPNDTDQPDQAVALIRIEPEDGGISYWKVYLRRANGKVTIVDWLNYALGEIASKAIGGFALNVGTIAQKPDSGGVAALKAYFAAVKGTDPQQLLQTYDQLPPGIRENSLLMYTYFQAANRISPATYQTVLADLAPIYRKQDSYALLMFEYHQVNGDYAEAHKSLDKTAVQLGEDAGLDTLHAGLALMTEDYKSAIAYARDGINREPAFIKNYWVLLDALVFTENYADAVLVLNILEEGFGYQFDAEKLAGLEGYEAFGQSAPFNSWRVASSQ